MPPPFRPLPLLDNGHLQTLLKNLLPAQPFHHATVHRFVRLADGDQLALHDTTPPSWRRGDPMVIIVHGLSGCHGSPNVVGLANLLVPHRLRVVRVDLRGAGIGEGLARSTYNAGSSHDVRAAVVEMHACSPTSPIALVGFSLGGNIVLKLAGEAVLNPLPRLECVAAVSAPIDMIRCATLLERPSNRLYDAYFTSRLVRQVTRLQQRFPELPSVQFPPRLRLRLFDDLYTAPRGGFTDALDYYRRSAALPFLPTIQVPVYLLTARDDPFIAVDPYEDLGRLPGIEVHITEKGGHLGFIGRDGNGGFNWLEHRLMEWIVRRLPGERRAY